MKDKNRRTSRMLRKAMSFVLVAAMMVSSLAASPSIDAASKKQPKLAVKKKTLYYNKSGKKTYTLKIKKQKVKKIKKTKWKTSNKKVVSISKRKKTSVKLKAKKAGKAKITAIVKYTVKGSKKIKKKKLVCKVTSKAAAVGPTATATGTGTGIVTATATTTASATGGATDTPTDVPTDTPTQAPTDTPTQAPTDTPTQAPTDTPTQAPTDTPTQAPTDTPTQAPTDTPTPAPEVAEVAITVSGAAISLTKDKNTVALEAVVKDTNGEVVEDPELTWKSEDETIATVDKNGVVTAVKEGETNVTASVGEITSAPCKITVDAKAPVVSKTEVTKYDVITVTFNEAVKGVPAVTVKNGDKAVSMTPALAEDGMSLVLTSSVPLVAAKYDLVINGLTDLAGNELAKDTKATVTKDASVAAEFVCETEKAPVGETIKIYYTVKDQYGEVNDKLLPVNLTVTAKIPGTDYPLVVTPKSADETGKAYVELAAGEDDAALVAGKTVEITMTNTISKDKAYTSKLEAELVDAKGLHQAVEFAKLVAASVNMKMEDGSADTAPVFILDPDAAKNVFTLTPSMLDKFRYLAKFDDTDTDAGINNRVKYVIADTTMLTFADGKTAPQIMNANATFKVLKTGTTKVTVYLENDDTVHEDIYITVKPVTLTGITVGSFTPETSANNDNGKFINGKAYTTSVTLAPAGTGLKASDLNYVITSGADACDSFVLAEKDGKITATIKAKTNSKDNTIKFVIYKGEWDAAKKDVKAGGVKSAEQTYTSVPSTEVKSISINPFDQYEITEGEEAETEYTVENVNGEDIAATVEVTPSIGDARVLDADAISAVKGKLKVKGKLQGTTTVTLACVDNKAVSAMIDVMVDPERQVAEIKLADETAVVVAGDPSPAAIVGISAVVDQYGKAYKLTKTKAAAQLKLTNADLTVNYYKNLDKKELAGDNDEVAAIGINYSGTAEIKTDTAKTVKIESTKTPAAFTAVTLNVTVRPVRKENTLKFTEAALTALRGVETTNSLSIIDQYDVAMGSSANVAFIVKDSAGKDVTSVTAVKGAYDSKTKTHLVTVTAAESGTYTVTAYVDNDGKAGYTANDLQASFILTAGAASNVIDHIVIEKNKVTSAGTEYDLSKADYVKVAANGEAASELVFTYKAYDKNDKEIAGASDPENVNGLVWDVTGTGVVTEVTKDNKIMVKTAKDKAVGSVTATLDFTPGENIKDTITIPVSSAAPGAKAGTYTIYRSDDAKKADVKNTAMQIAYDEEIEFVVAAKDQYGADFEPDTDDFYSIVSTDEDFATVTATSNTLAVKRVTTNVGEAVIKVMVDKDTTYTLTMQGSGGNYLQLADTYQPADNAPESVVAESDGSITITTSAAYQGVKIPVPAELAKAEYVETFVTTYYDGAEHTNEYNVKIRNAKNEPLNGTQWGGGQFPSTSKYTFTDLPQGESMAWVEILGQKAGEKLNIKYIRFVEKISLDLSKMDPRWNVLDSSVDPVTGAFTGRYVYGYAAGAVLDIPEEYQDCGSFVIKVTAPAIENENGMNIKFKFTDSEDWVTLNGDGNINRWCGYVKTHDIPQGKKVEKIEFNGTVGGEVFTVNYVKAIPR